MADDSELMQSNAAFLRELGDDLLQVEGVDADVVEVLREHVLVPNPSEDAVHQAVDGLIRLARQRADSPDEGGN